MVMAGVAGLPFIDAETLMTRVPWLAAIDALDDALARGLDVAAGPPRRSMPVPAGELLLMPAQTATAVGVKVLGSAPDNRRHGRPAIQGVYVLFDAATLTPRVVLDGAALTTLRTPAVSALAVRYLAVADASRLVVFGSGPQAEGHVAALRAVRPVTWVRIVGRDQKRADDLAARLRADGLDAKAGTAEDARRADLVVCATTSREPLIAAAGLADRSCVVAVGTHYPDARELAADVLGGAARVVVEERQTALREAGDVVLAVAEGMLTVDRLVELAQLPGLPPVDGRTVFKSVGMAWQDLVVAEAAVSG
jgi:ornithine cyclodeaminase/alanine dehydrogenase-like protein (mu-crystallin family)